MTCGLITAPTTPLRDLCVVSVESYPAWLARQSAVLQHQLSVMLAAPKVGAHAVVVDTDHQVCAVAIIDPTDSLWCLAGLVPKLPNADYQLQTDEALDLELSLLGWALAHYEFSTYKTHAISAERPNLSVTAAQFSTLKPMIDAVYGLRDLINQPPNVCHPEYLHQTLQQLGETYGANVTQTVGEDLLAQQLNAIWSVGAAGHQAPRLLQLSWGHENHPTVALVGKGVCFDTGGLDIKPPSGMKLMKKDMGGAAHVLALAQLIMAAKLPVNLRVLIPAVENNIAANAYRPSDVIQMANGTTVEVGDTDAEGRLVVADAFTVAAQYAPELLIDFTTLTGASRVALGPSVGAMFTNDDQIACDLQRHSDQLQDPLWRLPLVAAYQRYLHSHVADQNNIAKTPYGGAITAALFLQSFVPDKTQWVHFDVMAWNVDAQPGRQVGGEAMGVRAVFGWLKEWLCAR